jgi:hypothetical protein
MRPIYPYADPPSWMPPVKPRHGTYFVGGLMVGISIGVVVMLLIRLL